MKDGINFVTNLGRSNLISEGLAYFLHSGKDCMVLLSTVVRKILGKVWRRGGSSAFGSLVLKGCFPSQVIFYSDRRIHVYREKQKHFCRTWFCGSVWFCNLIQTLWQFFLRNKSCLCGWYKNGGEMDRHSISCQHVYLSAVLPAETLQIYKHHCRVYHSSKINKLCKNWVSLHLGKDECCTLWFLPLE